MKKIIQTIVVAIISATVCACSQRMQSESINAAENQVLRFTFQAFTNSTDAGRQAIFRITNTTDYIVIGFKGSVLGYDRTGQKIYDILLSHSSTPYLVEPYGTTGMLFGFEIPTNVERVAYEASDCKIIRTARLK